MRKISPREITGSVFDRINRQWLLLTAEKDGKVNTMTCSWGGLGVIWAVPAATVYVRPQRYTLEFLEAADGYTLSFLPEKYRAALNLLGSKSGRGCDKIAQSGLTVVKKEGLPSFAEAELVLYCRKLYCQFLTEESFIDRAIADKMYPDRDFHKMYIGEITAAFSV